MIDSRFFFFTVMWVDDSLESTISLTSAQRILMEENYPVLDTSTFFKFYRELCKGLIYNSLQSLLSFP